MKTGKTVLRRKTAKLVEVILPMLELGPSSRRMAETLNRHGLRTAQSNSLWTASSINQFCTNHGKELGFDDGESLFQSKNRPSDIEDFFPYPNYGPFS